MAHPQELKFVELAANFILQKKEWSAFKVLEVGSHDVNGSIRSFFHGSEYLGVDLSPGVGVDIVSSGHKLEFEENFFDVTISCECFEHNPEWVATFANMHRMTKSDGYVVVTCATKGRREHGTARTNPEASPGTQYVSWNYYRNLTKVDFNNHFKLAEMFSSHLFLVNKISKDLYFIGVKKSSNKNNSINLNFIAEELFSHNSYVVPSNQLYNILVFLYRCPRLLAEMLPDKHFQNFSILYDRVVRTKWIVKNLKKLISNS